MDPESPQDRRDSPLPDTILVTEKDAARACEVSTPTFRQWVKAGRIRPVDLPGGTKRNLYRRADLELFAASLAARP